MGEHMLMHYAQTEKGLRQKNPMCGHVGPSDEICMEADLCTCPDCLDWIGRPDGCEYCGWIEIIRNVQPAQGLNDMNSCEKNGHIFGSRERCLFCNAERPTKSWPCSECGEKCTEDCPHTCYANYEYLRLRVKELKEALHTIIGINSSDLDTLPTDRATTLSVACDALGECCECGHDLESHTRRGCLIINCPCSAAQRSGDAK